jgi:hypothetical protein
LLQEINMSLKSGLRNIADLWSGRVYNTLKELNDKIRENNKMSTDNERRVLEVASVITEVTQTLNGKFEGLKDRIAVLMEQAQSPEIHEVEDLSQEFSELDEAMSRLKGLTASLSDPSAPPQESETGQATSGDATIDDNANLGPITASPEAPVYVDPNDPNRTFTPPTAPPAEDEFEVQDQVVPATTDKDGLIVGDKPEGQVDGDEDDDDIEDLDDDDDDDIEELSHPYVPTYEQNVTEAPVASEGVVTPVTESTPAEVASSVPAEVEGETPTSAETEYPRY